MFVFFHVGSDLAMPQAMVGSILESNPGATVVQVTDETTPQIAGTVYRTRGDPSKLMAWRTRAFGELGLTTPALYLDTDMIVRHHINPSALVGDADIAMCRRSFNREATFNRFQRGQDYAEHEGKPLDVVYPFVGCATITPSFKAWVALSEIYQSLPHKYQVWYGDQEVLREYAVDRKVAYLPEEHYACLPEYLPAFPDPAIIHYKGARKSLMPIGRVPA